MKALLHIVSALLLVALAAGCRPSEAERALRNAEALMETRPDSALTLLEAIDGSRLSGEPRARHALLLSQAYDKNYIDLTDDSLISIAVNFYDNSSDDRRRMLALHYKGTVNRNAGFYESALASALEAHDLALALNDTLNLCRIESLMANLYDHSYNMEEAVKWETSALTYAKALNRAKWISNGYYNLANYLVGLGNSEEAKFYADSAAIRYGISYKIQDLLYRTNIGIGDYQAADSIYRQMLIDGNMPSLQILAMQALIPGEFTRLNLDMDSCRAFERCSSAEDSIANYIIMSRLASGPGSNDEVVSSLNAVIDLQNDLFTQLNSRSLLKVQSDYESRKSVKLEHSLHEKKKVMWLLATICLLVVMSTVFAVRWILSRNRVKRLALEMNLRVLSEAMSQIKAELAESREECTSLHDEAATNADKFRRQSAIAFLSKFEWVEKLGNMCLDADMSPNSSRTLQSKVKEELSGFKKELTDIVNANRDNLIARIEAQCPSLTGSEMDYVVLSCAGLSQRVIAFLLSKTPQSVYNLKSRARAKISSEAPALFAEYCALTSSTH